MYRGGFDQARRNFSQCKNTVVRRTLACLALLLCWHGILCWELNVLWNTTIYFYTKTLHCKTCHGNQRISCRAKHKYSPEMIMLSSSHWVCLSFYFGLKNVSHIELAIWKFDMNIDVRAIKDFDVLHVYMSKDLARYGKIDRGHNF